MEFIEVSNPQSFDNIQSWDDLNQETINVNHANKRRKKGKGFIRRLAKSKLAALATGGMSKVAQRGTMRKLAGSKILAVATGGVSRLPAPRAMKKRKLRVRSVTGVGSVAVEPSLRPDVTMAQQEEIPTIMDNPNEQIPEILNQEETPEIEPEFSQEPPDINGEIITPDGDVPEFDPEQNIPDMDEENPYSDNVTKVGKFLRKAAKSKVLAIATGGVSKLGSKEGRKEAAKVAKAIGKVAGSIALAPLLAPLLPLVPMMKNALKKKKLAVPKGLLDLANAFYNNIVKKSSSHYEYDDIDISDEDHIAPVIITAIVSGIIKFIKDAKAKKAAGKKLSPIEQGVADDTEKVQALLVEKAKDEAAGAIGSKLLFDKKTQIIIGIVAAGIIGLIIYLMMRKK